MKILFISTLLGLLLLGCSNEAKLVEKKSERTTPSEVEREDESKNGSLERDTIIGETLPETLAQLSALRPGKSDYLNHLDAEDRKEIDNLIVNLPTLSDSSSEEEMDRFYEALLSVFQQDYEGPNDLIDRMRFQSIGSPKAEDPRLQFKDNLNVMIVLDASGSMGNYVGGQTQMQAAKIAISNFVTGLPKDANVGLRVYGHKGTGSASDKAMSCSSSESIYPLGLYDGSKFKKVLDGVQPAGWTPTELALNEAKKDLTTFKGTENTTIVYLVGDGISTCDDDPVEAAKQLYNSDILPIINVIGFNADIDGQKQLKAVAEATNGSYQDVQSAEGLQEELNQVTLLAEKWEQWKTSSEGWLDYDNVNNGLDIFAFHAKQYQKWVDERQQIGFVLSYLAQEKKQISTTNLSYLEEKNRGYHEWIEKEYDKLRVDLEALNDKKYTEAIQSLEKKYKGNISKP